MERLGVLTEVESRIEQEHRRVSRPLVSTSGGPDLTGEVSLTPKT